MSIIKSSSDIEPQRVVKMMIYGQAGAGKTTLALSAPAPLLVDFDGGVRRVNYEHLDGVDVVQVNKWADVLRLFTEEDLSSYRTIVVDTVGKMMDYIIESVCGSRPPQIRDWTRINGEFQRFCAELGRLGKNSIFVAHRDTRREGEDTVYIPALREKNLNTIVTELDLLGYLEMRVEAGRTLRTITFDPSSRNEGKNTCGLPLLMTVPTIVDGGRVTGRNDFVAEKVLRPYLERIEEDEQRMQQYNERKKDIELYVAQITDETGANGFADYIRNIKAVGTLLMFARAEFAKRVAELGLAYDKATKTYKKG